MVTVDATELKNRLGQVLEQALLGTVAIKRHGRVVAYLVPAKPAARRSPVRADVSGLDRRKEERLAKLAARGDLRPARWRQAGDAQTMAGFATMLASQPEFDRTRMLALAEQLDPGMTTPERFSRWLEVSSLKPARLLPLVRSELAAR